MNLAGWGSRLYGSVLHSRVAGSNSLFKFRSPELNKKEASDGARVTVELYNLLTFLAGFNTSSTIY